MKQTGRVTLLVVTTVVAMGGFATLWMTRPSMDNEMIEVARERQLHRGRLHHGGAGRRRDGHA